MSIALEKAGQVRLLVLDVDGVLSNGQLLYGNDGEELKGFYTPDGVGIKLLQRAGIPVAIITGRQSRIVARRAAELDIEHVIQGRDDKLTALREMLLDQPFALEEVAYMGDDLPDLAAIKACGLGMTVAGADPFVASHADWCSQLPGGGGAVREASEFILQAQDKLNAAREQFLAPAVS